MTDLKRYFVYHAKTTLIRLFAIMLLCLIVTVITVSDGCDRTIPENANCSIYILSVVLCICASVMPIFEFAPYTNKRNLDTVFSLPVKRKSIALANFINGFIHTTAVFTACTVGAVLVMLRYSDYLSIIYIIPYYFTALALGAIIYSFVTFIFLQANTTFDGIAFILMWIANMFLVSDAIRCLPTGTFVDKLLVKCELGLDYLVLYEPVDSYTIQYQDLINQSDKYFRLDTQGYVYTVFWAIIAVLCIFGIFAVFEKKRTENAGEISTAVLGYKINIPLYMVSLSVLLDSLEAFAFIFVCALVAYFVYRRGFKLKKCDIITLLSSSVLSVILILLTN